MPQYIIYKGRKCGSTARGTDAWTKKELVEEATRLGLSTTGSISELCARIIATSTSSPPPIHPPLKPSPKKIKTPSPRTVPKPHYKLVWVVADPDGEIHGVYANRVTAIQGCLNIMEKVQPGSIDILLASVDLEEPVDWSDPTVVNAMYVNCIEDNYTIKEVPYFE